MRALTLILVLTAGAAWAREPTLAGGGTVITCSSGERSTGADLAGHLAQAEQSVLYVETEAALAALDRMNGAMACLGEPLDPAVASRAWFLRGYLAYEDGDAVSARAAFSAAHTLQPGLGWDPNVAPRAQATFEAARGDAQERTIPLAIDPVPAAGALYVDGRPTGEAPTLSSGPHVIQVMQADPVSVIVTLLPETRPVLSLPVQRAAEPAVAVADTPPADPARADDKRRRGLMWTGMGAASVGLTVMAVGAGAAKRASDDAAGLAANDPLYVDAQTRYDGAVGAWRIGGLLAAGGAVTLGVYALLDARVRVAPLPLAGGGGLRVAWGAP